MLAVLWQWISQFDIEPNDPQKSYWLINCDFGFVRRGLGGEVAQILAGNAGVSELVLTLLVSSVAALPACSLVVVVLLLARQCTTPSVALAVLLVCSPLTFDPLFRNRTPDQLGLVFLVGAAFILLFTRGKARVLGIVAAGIFGGAIALIHEASMAVWGIFALVILASVEENLRWRTIAGLGLFGPAAASIAAVSLCGRRDASLVSSLLGQPEVEQHLRNVPSGDPRYGEIIRFMGDGLGDSVALVASVPIWKLALMVAWGIAMLFVHAWWCRKLVAGFQLGIFDSRAAALAWLAVGAAAILVFATGIDWLRWFSSYGTGVLVVGAFRLGRKSPHEQFEWEGTLPSLAVGVAVYLATRAPVIPEGPYAPFGFVTWWF